MSDRRDFFRKAAFLTAGLAARSATAQQVEMPTPRVKALLDSFGVEYPIFCAGMGSAASPDLAIAISNAGGVGALGSAGIPQPNVVGQMVSRIKSATRGPFAVNFLLAFDPVALPAALDAGAPIIQFAWGIPSAEIAASVRNGGAKMGIQVGSRQGARLALDAGAHYLICQGTEAGGHVQATSALYDVLASVIDEAGQVPVIAAGGIGKGAHIRRALLAGASGVLVGTRFVATKEASVHQEYKDAITRASASDTVMTICFQNEWPNATHRALRNRTFQRWEAAGCPPAGKRPGEGDIVATNPTTGPILRYSLRPPQPEDRGAVTDMALYAGQGVDAIRDVPSAGDLVKRLWAECLSA